MVFNTPHAEPALFAEMKREAFTDPAAAGSPVIPFYTGCLESLRRHLVFWEHYLREGGIQSPGSRGL